MTTRFTFIVVVACFSVCSLSAQSVRHDLQALGAEVNSNIKKAESKQTVIGVAFHNTIQAQLGRQCFFELECGPFSRESLREYGPVKGFFMSIDRLSRCNRFAPMEFLPSSQRNGKVIDDPQFYRFRK